MEKTARVRWSGGLHFDALTGLGGAAVLDGDDDVPGLRASEAVLVALGACAGSDVASILGKKRQPLTGYEVQVRGTQRGDHPRVFTTIEVLHIVHGPALDPEAVRRSIELSATRNCPVTAQLCSGDVVIDHRYRLEDEGPAPSRVVEVAQTGPHGRIVVHAHEHGTS